MKKNFIITLLLLICVIYFTGCAGIMIRNMSTDEVSFENHLQEIGPVPETMARLVVYTIGAGPNVFNTAGSITPYTLDNRVYNTSGNTYYTMNVTPGMHEFSYDGVYKRGLVAGKYELGKNVFNLEMEKGKTYYLKAFVNDPDITGVASDYMKLEVVSGEVAKKETQGLKLYDMWDTRKNIELD